MLEARPLKVREAWATELFGDYSPQTMPIRVWMRTAVRQKVTSFGTFLSTLCHEFFHHLDIQKFGFPDSWHTRGFYQRTPGSITMRGQHRQRNCSGSKSRVAASESIGRGRIGVGNSARFGGGAVCNVIERLLHLLNISIWVAALVLPTIFPAVAQV